MYLYARRIKADPTRSLMYEFDRQREEKVDLNDLPELTGTRKVVLLVKMCIRDRSYSTPGGQVDIQASAQGRYAEITIRNQGLEIPEGELSNIFDKFYRLDAARSSRTGGAGLGLAIAKEIVELHQGTIRCESNGSLTSFIISLPLHKEARHGLRRNRAGVSEPK